MVKIDIPKLECKRCGHKWWPRKEDVRQCPNCKSALWDKEPKKKNKKENEDNERE